MNKFNKFIYILLILLLIQNIKSDDNIKKEKKEKKEKKIFDLSINKLYYQKNSNLKLKPTSSIISLFDTTISSSDSNKILETKNIILINDENSLKCDKKTCEIDTSLGQNFHFFFNFNGLNTEKDERFEPQQMNIRLSKDDTEAYFPVSRIWPLPKLDNDDEEKKEENEEEEDTTIDPDIFSVTMNLQDSSKKLNYLNGEYEIELIIGDSLLKNYGFIYKIGKINVIFPPQYKKQYPIYSRSLLHESDNTLEPLEEMQHHFREPEQRPPIMLSMVFAGLTCVPFLIFLYFAGIHCGGLKITLLFKSFFGLIFISSLTCMLLLFILYWIKLNMFTTLYYAFFLSILMFFSGQRALKDFTTNVQLKKHIKDD